MISLDFKAPETIAVNILKGDFQRDLEKIKNIPGREWNKLEKKWEFPWYQLGDLLQVFPDAILKSPVLQSLKQKLSESFVPWNSLAPHVIPIEFTRFPKTYQERYIRINKSKNRLLCAFEQGCGKTYTSLERVKFLGYQRLLIVCPKVVCSNWRAEVRSVLGQEAIIYQGAKRNKVWNEMQTTDRPVIATYESVHEVAEMIEECDIGKFDQILLDEAHLISNPESKRFKQVVHAVRLNKGAGIQCLTGTPMQHRIKDIWAIIHMLNPLLAGGYEAFQKRFMMPVKWMSRPFPLKDEHGKPKLDEKGKPVVVMRQIEVAWRPFNLHKLEPIMNAISYRVKREDVTTFEDAMETVTVELTPRQRRMYERLRDALIVELKDKTISLRHVPVRLLRLLQAAEGLFNFDSEDEESGKLDYIKHALDNATGKVIVWSRFKPITELLGRLYKDRCVVYNGSRSDAYKQFAKWSFNGLDSPEDEPEYRKLQARFGGGDPGWAQFFFGTVDMRSSLGMNLHTDCSMQIFSSFSWMGAANMQAADRLRRIGQLAARVRTIFLVGEDTFELRALNVVMRNFQDTLKALDGTERMSFKQISQIIELLRAAM